jgi:hypothetical protein
MNVIYSNIWCYSILVLKQIVQRLWKRMRAEMCGMCYQLVLLQEGEDGIDVVLHLAGTLVGNSKRLLQLSKDQPKDAGCSEHEHDAKALPRENGDRLIEE